MDLGEASAMGRQLASALYPFRDEQCFLLLLAPGGIPVGIEIARHLDTPVRVLTAGEVALPDAPGAPLGAIDEFGNFFLELSTLRQHPVPDCVLETCVEQALADVSRRARIYREAAELPDPYGSTLILVSDSFDRLSIARVAIASARRLIPRRLLMAVPTLSPKAFRALSPLVSTIYTLRPPTDLPSAAPERPSRVSDAEAACLLKRFRAERASADLGRTR